MIPCYGTYDSRRRINKKPIRVANKIYFWWNAYLQLLVIIYLWITISHPFVCFSDLFTSLWVNSIWATVVLSIIWEKQLSKKNVDTLNSIHQTKKAVKLWQWFLLNLLNLRDLFGVGTNLNESIFKSNNQINSTVTTRTWVLSTEGSRTWPSTW